MLWRDIPDSKASELDRLAEWYGVHSIHVKECRTAGKSRKADQHLFIVLKTLVLETDNHLTVSALSLFVGCEYLITVNAGSVLVLDALRQVGKDVRPDEVL